MNILRCRDCKHNHISIWSPFAGKFDECTSPRNPRVTNYVNGKRYPITKYSEILRIFHIDTCSPSAKWFEPKIARK
jgi:hypothetical protein